MKKSAIICILFIFCFMACEKEDVFIEETEKTIVKRANAENPESEIECRPESASQLLYIKNVIYNDYTNGLGYDFENESEASSYSDFTHLCIDINQNSEDHTILIAGSDNTSFRFSVWVDLNQNGDFDDPGEQIKNNANSAGGLGVTASLNGLRINPGNTTMRIIISSDAIGGPCDNIENGEIEDYVLCVENCSCDIPEFNGFGVEQVEGCLYFVSGGWSVECENVDDVVSETTYILNGEEVNGALMTLNSGSTNIVTINFTVTDINGCNVYGSETIEITLDDTCSLVPTCEVPTNPELNCGEQRYTWDSVPNAIAYQIRFSYDGYTECCNIDPQYAPRSTTFDVDSNELLFEQIQAEGGLPRIECGNWKVRAICDNELISDWSEPICILQCPVIADPTDPNINGQF